MAGIRPFVEGDIPQVADLLWKYLHDRTGTAAPVLKVYLKELFLQNPWLDDGIVSRVYEDGEGKIGAFFGAVQRRMTFQGKPIRLAFGSNFVVDPTKRTSTVAIQLVRTFMKGSQDISITDSATDESQQVLRSLGFSVVPIYSLHWARPLRITHYGINAISRLKKNSALLSLLSMTGPIWAGIDSLAAKVSFSPFRQVPPTTVGVELDIQTHLECLASLPGKQLLLPEYDLGSLGWLLDFLKRRKALGEVRKILVRDEEQKILGWFIYYVTPGDIGEVVQIGGKPTGIARVLDHLFYDAWTHKLIGLHGRLEPQFMDVLTKKSCFFFRNGSWTLVHSSKPDLVAMIQSGSAFFSRLDGEWCLRPFDIRLQSSDLLALS